MKKTSDIRDEVEMRDEYDFSRAVRGKHFRAYRAGHTVRIHKANGTTEVRHFTQKDDPNPKVNVGDIN